MDYRPGICIFCGTGCGHLLKVTDGDVEGVFPLQKHPVSKGRLCVRGWNIHELLRTNQRIVDPLVKKNGKLEKTSYDGAISAVVDKLSKYSPEEIAFLASPRSSNEENYLLMKLARSVFQTNNISIDSESGHRNSLNVLNAGTGMAGMNGSLEDIKNADYILVVDIDITVQNPIIASEIHLASVAGSRLVSLDSRKTQMAKLSDIFLQSKPGTSKLVIAAMARIIADENLIDSKYIEKNTKGYKEFASSLGSINVNEISSITGVKSEDIRKAAVDLAKADSAMVFLPSGISGLDEDIISYIFNLFLMAGKIGKPGCGVNPVSGINNLQGAYDMGLAPDLLTGFRPLSDESAVKSLKSAWGKDISKAAGKPVYDLLSAKNSSLKALVVVDHDECIVKYADAIKKLDFVVYIGAFDNDFKEYADVVLPIASFTETDGTYTNAERRVQLAKKRTEPANSVLPGWKLYSNIAEKASSRWNYNSSADVMNEIAKVTPAYSGISHSKLDGTFGIQWPCNDKNPDGTKSLDISRGNDKLNFVKVSGKMDKVQVNDNYPLLLMIGKARYFWHQNNIVKKTKITWREFNATLLLYPKGYVEICAEDAKNLGVRNKWPVKLVSSSGEMAVEVMISDEVKPGTAYVPYFIQNMIGNFLLEHKEILKQGEDAAIPVRIQKV